MIWKLPTLKYRRLTGDILEVSKIITGASNMDVSVSLHLPEQFYTTGRPNSWTLTKAAYQIWLKKIVFANRIVDIWNSLPDNVVSASSLNSFKSWLDAHWVTQQVLYNWEANICGTGREQKLCIMWGTCRWQTEATSLRLSNSRWSIYLTDRSWQCFGTDTVSMDCTVSTGSDKRCHFLIKLVRFNFKWLSAIN